MHKTRVHRKQRDENDKKMWKEERQAEKDKRSGQEQKREEYALFVLSVCIVPLYFHDIESLLNVV